MITPLDAFLQWFDDLPVPLRRHLAHIFRICTTDDTSQMVALPQQSLERFRHWAVKSDFPLRTAARLFYIRSIFDMVILHHKEICRDDDFFPISDETKNIIQLSSRQWEDILESWIDLRSKEMSDTYVHSWTSWMIKLQSEAK
ncbi:MAG TPA: hypothetical protein DCR95_11175 [Desulfobacter sp.]|uniref:hypothetical protein n=1 Tax=unclassified Desulfobacter TaxID=2634406 RepID=UPI000E870B9B|nr:MULTISPECIES: hypothetical protein [unclassified Desulfobacter]MBP8829408.1 hypothetical protein [Desulfobacter sp.]MBP9599689.1 hypothetical protein [Desulfobacter sp.]HAR34612.1 hypothetical protein [Desulfobacter sp.]HBT87087.1 hypothetical protein [Desulfobacter sp.]